MLPAQRSEIIANVLFALNENFFVKSHLEFANCVNEWLNTIIRNPSVSNPPEDDFSSPFLRYFSLCNAAKTSNNNVSQVKKLLRQLRASANHCRFNVPQVRTRIEKLMGTNCVSLTDRDYMQKLQHRILEDYGEQMEKRIKVREEDEMERVKNLVLVGKIPLDQAPPEMAHHPMMLIENYCNQLIAERRAKIKIYKVKIPTYLYWDDTPDPPSRLSIESEHLFRQVEKFYKPLESTDDENIEGGYVAPQKDYDRIRYESPLIKQLMICETVEEMYALADDIIGALKTINETTKVIPDGVLETGD
ncbi:uncharacterized protein [Euwallacea fornicatus]|uniref:uncharacterized protein isoform X1 n=1 Tax=Euwallacea fornicatus TaxID=995702 RepID=UPI00338E83B4